MRVRLMRFFLVFIMKVEDIKKAVVHAAEAEFKRAFYNCAAVMSAVDIEHIYCALHAEVYESDGQNGEN